MTDLAGTQLSSLLETLPGIAQVLRSPVADAFIGVIRAASGQGPFNMSDAEEILRYAVRRNLLSASECERILAETAAAVAARPAPKPKAKAKAPPRTAARKPARKAAKAAPRPAARKAKAAPARRPRKPAKVARKK
jgi:hypothetical protein